MEAGYPHRRNVPCIGAMVRLVCEDTLLSILAGNATLSYAQ